MCPPQAAPATAAAARALLDPRAAAQRAEAGTLADGGPAGDAARHRLATLRARVAAVSANAAYGGTAGRR